MSISQGRADDRMRDGDVEPVRQPHIPCDGQIVATGRQCKVGIFSAIWLAVISLWSIMLLCFRQLLVIMSLKELGIIHV